MSYSELSVLLCADHNTIGCSRIRLCSTRTEAHACSGQHISAVAFRRRRRSSVKAEGSVGHDNKEAHYGTNYSPNLPNKFANTSSFSVSYLLSDIWANACSRPMRLLALTHGGRTALVCLSKQFYACHLTHFRPYHRARSWIFVADRETSPQLELLAMLKKVGAKSTLQKAHMKKSWTYRR